MGLPWNDRLRTQPNDNGMLPAVVERNRTVCHRHSTKTESPDAVRSQTVVGKTGEYVEAGIDRPERSFRTSQTPSATGEAFCCRQTALYTVNPLQSASCILIIMKPTVKLNAIRAFPNTEVSTRKEGAPAFPRPSLPQFPALPPRYLRALTT